MNSQEGHRWLLANQPPGQINRTFDDGLLTMKIAMNSTNKAVMRLIPKNLLIAMWLQFAQSVTGGKKLQACRLCGTWFEISTDLGRNARREFCSDACKSRDYRARKDRAIELRAEGLKPTAIVDKLKEEGWETDIDTLKKWTNRKGAK